MSDFFDFSIYLDADEALLEKWYVQRFMTPAPDRVPRSRARSSRNTSSSPTRRPKPPPAASGTASTSPNLRENVLPTRPRASLVLTKGASHRIEKVALRKL